MSPPRIRSNGVVFRSDHFTVLWQVPNSILKGERQCVEYRRGLPEDEPNIGSGFQHSNSGPS